MCVCGGAKLITTLIATGTSVTMLTTLPSTDAMQQTVNGGMTRANGGIDGLFTN